MQAFGKFPPHYQVVGATILVIMLAACGGRSTTAVAPSAPLALPSGPVPTLPADADVESGSQSAEMVQRHDVIVLLHVTTGRDGSALDVNVVDNTLCPAPPLADVQRVLARITPAGSAGPPALVPLLRGPDAQYHGRGPFIRASGVWRIELRIERRTNWRETVWPFIFRKHAVAA